MHCQKRPCIKIKTSCQTWPDTEDKKEISVLFVDNFSLYTRRHKKGLDYCD